LIVELSSSDFAHREQAEDAIVARGTVAVPAITQTLATTQDVDLKERLQSALSRIDREQMLLPTLVTLDRTFPTPLDAFTAVAKATGLTVEVRPEAAELANAPAPVTIKVTDEPWLALLDRTIVVTGIGAQVDEDRVVLTKQDQIPRDRPTAVAGSVMVVAEAGRRRAARDLARDVDSGSSSLTLLLASEPKTRFRGNGPAVIIKRALDAEGNAIANNQRGQFSRQTARQARATVTFPGQRFGKVALLEAELVGEIVSRTEEVRVDDLTKLPATLTPAMSSEIKLLSMEQNSSSWVITATSEIARRPNAGPVELDAAIKSQTFEVLDQNGKAMACTMRQTTNSGSQVGLQLTVTSNDATARPTKVRWLVASQTREVKIPFVLHDMPMP
jgi:hypothetical protein